MVSRRPSPPVGGSRSSSASGSPGGARRRPGDVARALAQRAADRQDGWKRATFTLPRLEARDKAREWFDRYPKQAYMTEIEFWREREDGLIEFTIRRLPTAD